MQAPRSAELRQAVQEATDAVDVRLGVRVGYIGFVGDDASGALFDAEGVPGPG